MILNFCGKSVACRVQNEMKRCHTHTNNQVNLFPMSEILQKCIANMEQPHLQTRHAHSLPSAVWILWDVFVSLCPVYVAFPECTGRTGPRRYSNQTASSAY